MLCRNQLFPALLITTSAASMLVSGCAGTSSSDVGASDTTASTQPGDDDTSTAENSGSEESGSPNNDSGSSDDDSGSDTDTGSMDSDGDGLSDAAEAELGTDPNKRDTDDDTYWDSWEVTEGTDPLDPESRIYIGYWPYNPDKDSIEDPGWNSPDATASTGGMVPHFALEDQHGEMVDIYDYGGHDASIVFDFSALWCAPCRGISEWLSGGTSDITGVFSTSFPSVPEKVNTGLVYWVTILGDGATQGTNIVLEDLQAWDAEYPNEKIVVLAETPQKLAVDKYVAGGWPAILIVGPDMVVSHYPDFSQDPWSSLRLIDTEL